MSFKPKQYQAIDLTAPKGAAGNKFDSTNADSVRLNTVLSIGKTAPVGTAKEIVVALVGMFRATTKYGAVHALKCIDPDDGTEGVLFLNTKLVEFDDGGGARHYVAGNFDGNCLTTFGRRVSESVDEGYLGDFIECDGEWRLNEDFYGKVIHLGRKAIPPKNAGGRVYQVLEWRFETKKEYPDLPAFLQAYEDREESRASAADEAAPAPSPEPAARKKPAPTKAKPTAAEKPTRGEKASHRKSGQPAITNAETTSKGKQVNPVEQLVRDLIKQNIPPEEIAFDMQVKYNVDEGDALDMIERIADEMGGDEVNEAEQDPIVTRAIELFTAGSTPTAVSKKLTAEFVGVPRTEMAAAVKTAYAMTSQ